MSGFSNESNGGGNAKYANFSKGVIKTKVDGEMKSFTHLTGDLLAIDLEDSPGSPQHKIEPYRKIVLFVQHDQGITMLGFPFNSGYGQAFLKICPNIDLNKEVKISGGISKDKDSGQEYASLFIQQDEKYVQWYYKKGTKEFDKIPPVKEETVGKGKSAKIVKDYTDRDMFFEKLILGFQKKLEKVWPAGVKTAQEARKKSEPATEGDGDGLPF